MDDNTELRLLLRIAHMQSQLDALYTAAMRVVDRVPMPAHITAKNYSTTDTKRVPSRPLATLRNVVRALERETHEQS